MKFDITNIKKVSGAVMDIRYQGPLAYDDMIDMISVKGDIFLQGTLTNYENAILLKATLKFSYAGQCGRCLQHVTRSLTLELEEKFSTREIDDETYLYEGNFVDLTKAVTDNIIISLPLKLLCSDQCRGLCQVCGKNLNEETCQCEKTHGDTRETKTGNEFGVLKNYFSN